MKTVLISVLFTVAIFWVLLFCSPKSKGQASANGRTPVLVELFTSEGCSSCPPADRLLESLDAQPTAGMEVIVLSEHVDYWNHIGWRDPYSSHAYSERQSAYGRRFGLESVYTPQMVVDGRSEFVGSNSSALHKALDAVLHSAKIPVRLSAISATGDLLAGRLEIGNLDSSYGVREAEVYVATALNRAESQVSAGENAGHKLKHVSVVQDIAKIGTLRERQGLSQQIQIKIHPGDDPNNLRLIAFVQEPQQGRVMGAAASRVRAGAFRSDKRVAQ